MPFLMYFGIISCLLIAGTLLMNGWFTITRGHYVDKVDGTTEKVGKIFKGWYFFWFMESVGPKRIYYKSSHLEKLYEDIRVLFPAADIRVNLIYNYIVVTSPFVENLNMIEKKYGIIAIMEELTKPVLDRPASYTVKFFKEEPDYIFPWYIREVLAGCITCYSSVYGSIIFLTFNMLAHHSGLTKTLYEWTGYPGIAFVITWCFCMLSWSYLNTLFYKIMNR